MFNTYKDRAWCSRAKECSYTPCDRRLSKQDKQIIKEKEYLIAFDSFRECKNFKQKDLYEKT